MSRDPALRTDRQPAALGWARTVEGTWGRAERRLLGGAWGAAVAFEMLSHAGDLCGVRSRGGCAVPTTLPGAAVLRLPRTARLGRPGTELGEPGLRDREPPAGGAGTAALRDRDTGPGQLGARQLAGSHRAGLQGNGWRLAPLPGSCCSSGRAQQELLSAASCPKPGLE